MSRSETLALAATAFAIGASIVTATNASETSVIQPSYSTVVDNLRKASVPVREIGTTGKVAITLAAGRMVAIAFSSDGPNLLWSNPRLNETSLVSNHPLDLVGGFGGDRLWFAPELQYHWSGRPEWDTFFNYKTPTATDPGAYRFGKHDDHSVALHGGGKLTVHDTGHQVEFSVDRTFSLIEPPLPRNSPLLMAVDYIGVQTSHALRISDDTREGIIGLWHLLQMPVGSVLIVPTKGQAPAAQKKPLSYGLPGAWVEKPDHIMWRFGGTANAKLGLPAVALTGRSAVFRQLKPGRWCMLLREFPVDEDAKYGDHPYGVPRTDQVFQAWDGYGFGEMEYHSPAADAARGPRELTESDRLWAFGGSTEQIFSLAKQLLGIDASYIAR